MEIIRVKIMRWINNLLKDLCLSWHDECYRQTNLIKLLQNRQQLERHGIGITYPRANTDGTPIYLAYNIGGVDSHKNGTIKVIVPLIFHSK